MTCVQPASTQHGRRDLAGEGALRLAVHVLRGEQDARAGDAPGATASSAVKGGATSTSRPRHRADALCQRAGERGRLGARAVHLPVAGEQRDCGPWRRQPSRTFDAGQLASLEELERRAAAGRDVGDGVGLPGARERGDRVAAADDRDAATGRQRLGDRHRARGEGVDLEDAHRAVPEHRPRGGDLARRSASRSRGRCRRRAGRRESRRPAPPA